MVLYYEDFGKNGRVKIPITIQDVKKILDECKVINIKAKEPFPKGEVTFVGVGNDNYECRTLWDMRYTDHMRLAYGGYFNKDHSGYNAWWTMNYNYSDNYDKTEAYIVKNKDDGYKLAKFLNFVGGLSGIQSTIIKKQEEIKNLQEELLYLTEANNVITD